MYSYYRQTSHGVEQRWPLMIIVASKHGIASMQFISLYRQQETSPVNVYLSAEGAPGLFLYSGRPRQCLNLETSCMRRLVRPRSGW